MRLLLCEFHAAVGAAPAPVTVVGDDILHRVLCMAAGAVHGQCHRGLEELLQSLIYDDLLAAIEAALLHEGGLTAAGANGERIAVHGAFSPDHIPGSCFAVLLVLRCGDAITADAVSVAFIDELGIEGAMPRKFFSDPDVIQRIVFGVQLCPVLWGSITMVAVPIAGGARLLLILSAFLVDFLNEPGKSLLKRRIIHFHNLLIRYRF